MKPQPGPTPTAPGNIMKSLILPGIRNFFIAAIVLGLLLCLLAGTLEYWQGWVFAVLFSGLTNGQGIYLGIRDPELLERRKRVAVAGEFKSRKGFHRFRTGSQPHPDRLLCTRSSFRLVAGACTGLCGRRRPDAPQFLRVLPSLPGK